MTVPLLKTDTKGAFPLVARGKSRDVWKIDDERLFFVATDRISAFDVIMDNGIPYKGVILTFLSAYWFEFLKTVLPDLKTHFLTLNLPSELPSDIRLLFKNRSMQVRKLKIFPIEAIVRGYISGSAWKEYKKSGTMHGIKLPEGLQESQKLPDGPMFTPSTKAEQGDHDENIHPDEVEKIIGAEYAERIKSLAIKLYEQAYVHAQSRGIIIADTKFEFGLDEETGDVVLVDEVLTPDSSRFWQLAKYEPGRPQESFDKQYLRDWLIMQDLQGQEGVRVPEDVANKTAIKYKEVYERLTGKTFG